jgi:hypothetical protein
VTDNQNEISSRLPLRQDALVEQLIPDPADHPNSMLLSGFVSNSTTQGICRLYVNLELTEYLEFSEEDILHRQSLANEQHPMRGSVVWIRRGSTLRHARTHTAHLQADFMRGNITDGLSKMVTGVSSEALRLGMGFGGQGSSGGDRDPAGIPVSDL